MRFTDRMWLISAIICCFVIAIRCSPTSRDWPSEIRPPNNVNWNFRSAPVPSARQYDECIDNDNQFYKLSTISMKNDSDDAELGQELIDLLLRRGEIEEKSSYQPSENGTQFRREDHMNVDRYDELIAAFNVILEEILRQGDSRLQKIDSANGPNQIQNDNKSHEMYKTTKLTENGSTVDAMNRCLSPFEGELLKKIKSLNNQLNSFMRKSNNYVTKEKRNAHEMDSDSWNMYKLPQRNRKHPRLNVNNAKKVGVMVRSNRRSNRNYQGSGRVIPKVRLISSYEDISQNPMTTDERAAVPIKKRQANSKSDNQTELNKDNNYGVDRQQYQRDSEDATEQSSSTVANSEMPTVNSSSSTNNLSSNNSSTNDSSSSVGNVTNMQQKIPRIAASGIKIPMRLIGSSDGNLYLVLDRQTVCNKCQSRRQKPMRPSNPNP